MARRTGVERTESQDPTSLRIPVFQGSESELDGALKWAEAGWYVVPAAKYKKNPGYVVGGQWEDKASRDPAVIRAWFAGPRPLNVGVCPGRSNAFIMDIDRPEEYNLPEPPTDAIRIPSREDGSREHIFFLQPEGHPLGEPKVPWGDTRGHGGFVMVYPSTNPDNGGKQYPVPPPDVQGRAVDMPFPPDLLQAAGWPTYRKGSLPEVDLEDAYRTIIGREWEETDPYLADRILERFDSDSSSKGRHSALIHALSWMMKSAFQGKVDPDRMTTILRRRFLAAVAGDRDPYEAQLEFDRAVVFAVQTAEAEAAGYTPEALAQDPDVLEGVWKLISDTDLESLERSPEMVENTLPPSGIGQLVGQTFTGKTYVAVDLAYSIASPEITSWMGHEINEHGAVAYWLLEGEYDFGQRTAAWKSHHAITPTHKFAVLQGPGGVTVPEERVRMTRALSEHFADDPLKLLIIDTQSLAFDELDENSNTEMTRMVKACKNISRDLGCFVLLVHHASTKGDLGRDLSRGASAQKAGMDVTIEVLRDDAESDPRLKVTKYKPYKPWDTFQTFGFKELELPAGPEGLPRRGSVVTQNPDGAIAYRHTRVTEAHRELDTEIVDVLSHTGPTQLKHLHTAVQQRSGFEDTTYAAVNNAVSQRLVPSGRVVKGSGWGQYEVPGNRKVRGF